MGRLLQRSRNSQNNSVHPYDPIKVEGAFSAEAGNASHIIRGLHRPPVIMLHGVMPRSGTVYTGELLRLHPDVFAYPNNLWEIPFLETTGKLLEIQSLFLRRYQPNAERMGELDLLPLFGAALVAYLHSFSPEDKTVLIKIPDVQYLGYFPLVFPHENLLMLMRDGRDLVSSTVRTWKRAKFSTVCRNWGESAAHMLAFDQQYSKQRSGYRLFQYESVLEDPEGFVRQACQAYGLNPERYPFERIEEISYRGSSSLKKGGKVSWEPMKPENKTKTTGHWRKWSARQNSTFKKIAGSVLLEAGYATDQNW